MMIFKDNIQYRSFPNYDLLNTKDRKNQHFELHYA